MKLPESFYQLASCDKIREICDPFLKKHNLNYFCFTRFYWNNTSISAFTNPDVFRQGIEVEPWTIEDGYPVELFLEKNIIFNDDLDENTDFYKQYYKTSADKYDITHSVSLWSYRLGYVDCYIFGAPKANTKFKENLYKNIEEFNYFVKYFKQAAKDIIKKLKKNPVPNPKVKDMNLSLNKILKALRAPDPFESLRQILSEKTSFTGEVTHKKLYLDEPFDHIYLSPREQDIITYLVDGYSYKQIGKSAKLSWTTVREHVDNLRYKFNCSTKMELIDLLHRYNVISMIKGIVPPVAPLTNYQDLIEHYQKQVEEKEAQEEFEQMVG